MAQWDKLNVPVPWLTELVSTANEKLIVKVIVTHGKGEKQDG